jgi:hypothetical protein
MAKLTPDSGNAIAAINRVGHTMLHEISLYLVKSHLFFYNPLRRTSFQYFEEFGRPDGQTGGRADGQTG